MDDELAFRPATELLAGLVAGRWSSEELLRLYLDRIERVGGDVNAFVTIDPDRALVAARRADEARARGEQLGPLHGLPISIKDAFESEGLRTTAGLPALAGHVPARDADAVARLRAGGAVIFGKTNVPEGVKDGQAYNEIAGTTTNPWDPARTPGGSSGGSAAALAAGLTALELGSDISGSVRHPASFSGVYGLKPTYGIVPLRGHIPGPPGTLAPAPMNVAGPLARSADDLELALDVLAGPSPADAVAWRLELPPPRGRALADYRLAVWLDDEACRVGAEVLTVLRAAVDLLADAGARLEERELPVPLADAIRLHRMILMGVASSALSDDDVARLERAAATNGSEHLRWLLQRAREANLAREQAARHGARWAERFAEVDAVLCPVTPTAALEHDHHPDMDARRIEINGETRPYWDQVCWIAPASVAELPAVAAPVGLTAAGLPVGLQIVAARLEDRTAIDVARRVAEVVGGFLAPPAIVSGARAARHRR